MKVTIFGKGNMGKAIAKNLTAAGHEVKHVTHESDATLDEMVILAVYYPAVDDIINRYKDQLAGKIVVDITNPVNFDTFDGLVVSADSSAAAEIQQKLPNSYVVKGFNTTLAPTLDSGKVGDEVTTTVLIASDHQEAKDKLVAALEGSPIEVMDAGSLKRARELEAMGFLQITLASAEKIPWSAGFGIIK